MDDKGLVSEEGLSWVGVGAREPRVVRGRVRSRGVPVLRAYPGHGPC